MLEVIDIVINDQIPWELDDPLNFKRSCNKMYLGTGFNLVQGAK